MCVPQELSNSFLGTVSTNPVRASTRLQLGAEKRLPALGKVALEHLACRTSELRISKYNQFHLFQSLSGFMRDAYFCKGDSSFL